MKTKIRGKGILLSAAGAMSLYAGLAYDSGLLTTVGAGAIGSGLYCTFAPEIHRYFIFPIVDTVVEIRSRYRNRKLERLLQAKHDEFKMNHPDF